MAGVTSSREPSTRNEPVLITEAQPSLGDQHAARKRRYVITMLIRMASLLLAAAFYQTIWLMAVFAVLGTVLPWIAVVMANDRPPKSKLTVNRYRVPAPDRILEARAGSGRVIDSEA